MKRLLYLLIAIIPAMLMSGCGQTAAPARTGDSTALRLAVMPTMDCLPFYYADSMGLFDSLGINLRLVTFEAAMDADTAFHNGHVDGIVTDLVKQCLWQSRGDSLTSVMSADLSLYLVTSQSARLMKESSLKDKIIATTRHSAEDFFADRIMESARLKPTELNRPQINNLKLRTLMVDQNQIDGALLPEPFASEAVARGARRLASTLQLRLPSMMTVLFADSTARCRKSEVESIVLAYNRAVEMLNADTVSNRLAFIPAEHSVFLPDTLYSPAPYTPAQPASPSMIQEVKEWAKARGL